MTVWLCMAMVGSLYRLFRACHGHLCGAFWLPRALVSMPCAIQPARCIWCCSACTELGLYLSSGLWWRCGRWLETCSSSTARLRYASVLEMRRLVVVVTFPFSRVGALSRRACTSYSQEPELLETILTSAAASAGSAAGTGGAQLSAAATAAATSFPSAVAAAELAGLHFRSALKQEMQMCEQAAAGAAGGGISPAQAEAAATQLAAELADVSHKYAQVCGRASVWLNVCNSNLQVICGSADT